MEKGLSNEVKQALQDIYYNVRTGRGKEAFALLERASAAGDGNATCVLARCYCGYQYVWRGHGFPEDDEKATELMHKAVEQGSALAVLLCMRTGDLTPSLVKNMPFASLQEAFNEVLAMAEEGDAFCQYIIGNTYFWGDFMEIENKGPESFPDKQDFLRYLQESIAKCEDWFWKALRGGIYFAANNLNQFYTKGEEGIIAPRPEKAKDLYKIGAEYGYPLHQSIYADELKKAGRTAEALRWYKEAAEGGNPGDWYEVGDLYFEGADGVPKDEAYAVECFEKELARNPKHTGSNNVLGKAYYYGRGVPQDYAKAYQLLRTAYDGGNTWGVFYLGSCCFNGWGTPQDYKEARIFLEQVNWKNSDAYYMRGYLYANGLGGPEDIKLGVEYLQKAGDHAKAKEELLRYKKTLFGKWVRR